MEKRKKRSVKNDHGEDSVQNNVDAGVKATEHQMERKRTEISQYELFKRSGYMTR